ncbi:MAG TPA: ATP synthase F1 subunit gamma [Candidatus Paceibacterota bacterium]|nr:ATP synthase F1 subunit gamma [Candidatus Paceibacterota bacterium]
MSLKSVKSKIKSIDKTRQVTKAMEAVSAVKMRKSQALAIGMRPYALAALTILRNVSGSIDAIKHPYLTPGTGTRTLIVVVTSDKGLAGNYGSSVLKRFYRLLKDESLSKESVDLITIGRRGTEHFGKRGFTILAHYERWGDSVSLDDVGALVSIVENAYRTGSYARVTIVYTNFISTLKQDVYVRTLLPIAFASVEETVRGILPEHGKFSELRESDAASAVPEITYEPSPEAVLAELIPMLFRIELYHSVLEANASEHSARMIAMKNASDNARDISKALKLHFNKVRQAAITREVSEIVGGMESMKVSE